MKRRRLLCLTFLAVLAACSDTTPTNATRPTGPDRVRAVILPGTLDENISKIISFWPNGTATAIQSQWDGIKKRLEAGDVAGAQQKLVGLTKFILKKTDDMNTPPTGESKNAAASRLILYMSLYVFEGPDTVPPPFFPMADDAVGILNPNEELTLVTPTKHAGAHFDAGSVDETRIIVITQNPTAFPEDCTGPLITTLCQWPQFYDIESFPDGALLKVAQASVCHDNAGNLRVPPPGAHDNFLLAHDLPDDPANYVPGGIILDDEGNHIEILPLITQSFVICDDVEYHPPGGGGGGDLGLMGRGVYLAKYLASRVGHMILPRSAFAIDQGGGGEFLDFSPFNDVDTTSVPIPETPKRSRTR